MTNYTLSNFSSSFTDNPHWKGLSPFITLKEIHTLLQLENYRISPSLESMFFKWYVLQSINTLEDAELFCQYLDQEERIEIPKTKGCTKARIIRSWLVEPFWQESPERIRTAIASNRNVCCWTHERYSFAKR